MISATLEFALPEVLEAREPAEARGLARDEVRLLVAAPDRIGHHVFHDLPELLAPGDLLVVNNSGTLPAAIDAVAGDGTRYVVHFSTDLGEEWAVEPRRPTADGTTKPLFEDSPFSPGDRLRLTGGASLTLSRTYTRRLWRAVVDVPDVAEYLMRHGRPIRYSYTDRDWPIEMYQTAFATIPGSAEMPSAARPFTAELVTRLVSRGIGVAPITLHTGVASAEAHEEPYPEWYSVPASTARLVNHTRASGKRVIAIGTTVVRALESAAERPTGVVHGTEGWTNLVITPARGVRVVDGLLTGFHEPRASHLLMLEAIVGRELLDRSYAAAIEQGYLWHEFGDVNLLLRESSAG